MKLKITTLALAMLSTPLAAQDLNITITNLTHGSFFTPLIITAHKADMHMFLVGSPASDFTGLQAMAEGGSVSDIETNFQNEGADIVINPAGGLLAAGTSTTFTMNTSDANTQLSLTSMILPTNDGFTGINNLTIPQETGTYTYNLNAYDAGTEENNEIFAAGGGAPNTLGMPGPAPVVEASGVNGTGMPTNGELELIHIHRGVLGDTNSEGGLSDINSLSQRWLNPIARLVIVVQ